MYNGVKPWKCINVEDPTFYFANGFTTVELEPGIDAQTNYATKTVAELKSLCEDAGIEAPKNAKKGDLIALLEAADQVSENNEPEKEDDKAADQDDVDLLNELE